MLTTGGEMDLKQMELSCYTITFMMAVMYAEAENGG